MMVTIVCGYLGFLLFTAAASSETTIDHGFNRPIIAGIFWPIALPILLGIKLGRWISR